LAAGELVLGSAHGLESVGTFCRAFVISIYNPDFAAVVTYGCREFGRIGEFGQS
jgi:hypothetical protein